MTDIMKLKVDGVQVYPQTHKSAVVGLESGGVGNSKTGRRNYLTRTNSAHTNIVASETNSFASNLKVENIQNYKIKLTNDKALKENYYRFMSNEFGVLKPNQSYYFNGYLQLGAESNMRFTVYNHTSATNKSVVYQKIVHEEGDFSLNFTLPSFSNLTGITIQVEVINMNGDTANKSTDNISLFNLILALTDGDWTRAIEDFATAEDYIGLDYRVKELEKNGGGGTTTPPDTDTGWKDIQLLGGYKGDDFLKPQYRIKNGWVDFRGNILAVPKDKFNFEIGQIPYEAAPDKLKFFMGVVSHDEVKFAKLMLNGDGLLKMLVTQETGDISLDGLTYSSRTT